MKKKTSEKCYVYFDARSVEMTSPVAVAMVTKMQVLILSSENA